MTRMIGVWETQEAIRFDETIPARVAAVGPVVERVMAVVEHAGCVPDKAHDVDLAVREAVTNAVIHGSREDPEKEVHISVSCDVSGDVLVTVRDTGDGFDPTAVADPGSGRGLYRPNGRGLFLINELMDEVRFAHGGTEVRMRKRA